MNDQQLLWFNVGLAIVSGLSSLVIKATFDALRELRIAHQALEKEAREGLKAYSEQIADVRYAMSDQFARKDDLRRDMDNLFEAVRRLGSEMKSDLVRIEAKLDGKADKP